MVVNNLTITLKQNIFDKCLNILNEKCNAMNNVLLDLTDELKYDTKSSMGDKHETSRAMNQLEQEKVSNQISEINKQLTTLQQLNINLKSGRIITGSLIQTNIGLVFIAVGLGKIKIAKMEVIAISAHSPLGLAFLSKVNGENVLLNNAHYSIEGFI